MKNNQRLIDENAVLEFLVDSQQSVCHSLESNSNQIIINNVESTAGDIISRNTVVYMTAS